MFVQFNCQRKTETLGCVRGIRSLC
uniref:Uncharacterized protein n=1 Tax=Anguilla anguilla TaxID=7936 RepID=A0A0E9VRB5_ANGAN